MLNKLLCRRPWGWWLVLLDRRHFKVKLLRFRKDGELSLQKHSKRGEAWLFLSGYGDIGTCESGFWTHYARSGDYWHVKRESWHKYRAAIPTWILEIQYGDECVEEDIIRA